MPIRLIDLFSGAGGLSSGFHGLEDIRGSFRLVWANDFSPAAVATFNANFPGNVCVSDDIQEVLELRPEQIPRADLVIGGPPCQGYSLLNKKRKNDSRKSLWREFLDVVQLSGASAFLIENVAPLLNSPELLAIEREAARQGFGKPVVAKLLAADYGVPQTRVRAFVFASKLGDPRPHFPPPPTHQDPEIKSRRLPSWTTVGEAIADLPIEPVGTQIRVEEPPLDLHFGRNPTPQSMERYRAVPPGGNRVDLHRNRPDITPNCWVNKKGGTDLFGRLWMDRPSVTIRTEFFKPEKGRYLHPFAHRPITHREAARLQSFDDSFVFKGSKIEIARQIGNAVPPLLARHLAQAILTHFEAAGVPIPEEAEVE